MTRSWRRWVVVHPLLFAAWPLLFLYGRNVFETPPREALASLAVIVGVTAALLAGLTAVVRDARRAGLATTVVALAVLLYGHVRNLLDDPTWLLPLWLLAAAVLVALALRLRRGLAEATTILTGVAATLVVLAVVPIAQAVAPMLLAPRPAVAAERVDEAVGRWSAPGPPRDIYYLVFDRYGSEANLRERFGFDNSAFTRRLEQRGFYVAHDSRANHLKTAQSLASSLNLRYLDELAKRHGPDTGNLLPVYDLLQEHTVGRLLRDRGYEYVHIGAWWDPTQANRHAARNLGYEQRSDFQVLLYDTTLLSELGTRPSDKTADQHRRVHYDGALSQFRHLREVAQRPGPTFTFAHILLPHEPFVFDRDGDFVRLADVPVRGRTRNYVEQTQFTNDQIDALLDSLLDVPPSQSPIVVIQADEGPHPLRYKADEEGFDWEQATDAELREKFWILNAYHLPGASEQRLYPSISPVNTWRVIFNAYFGADLPLLEDRSFIYRDSRHVYDFSEITERIR